MRYIHALRPLAVRGRCGGGVMARAANCRAAAGFCLSSPAALQLRRCYFSSTATSYEHVCEVQKDGLKVKVPTDLAVAGAKQQRDKLSFMWLRDNCRCSQCINQDTTQRNFATFQLPLDIHPVEARADQAGVHVSWSDNHQSQYTWDFLQQYLYHGRRKEKNLPKKLWGAEIAENPPTVPYGEVMESDAGVAQVTANLMESGVCFINSVPSDDPLKTKTLLERIAFIRETHYGGFYDFTPDLAMADTAYTNIALPAHTDTTYFTDPAGLQAFHMLSHKPATPGGECWGGESLLVDGFRAAEVLRTEDKAAYEVLSKVALPWHASGNKGITITPDKLYPVLEHKASGELHRVRWNNDDRGVVPLTAEGGEEFSPDEWYAAARRFDEILRRKEMEYWFQLTPGRVVVFDNYRVLHGRAAFQGIRRMCGAYICRDDWVSRWLNTNYPRDEVLAAVRG